MIDTVNVYTSALLVQIADKVTILTSLLWWLIIRLKPHFHFKNLFSNKILGLITQKFKN